MLFIVRDALRLTNRTVGLCQARLMPRLSLHGPGSTSRHPSFVSIFPRPTQAYSVFYLSTVLSAIIFAAHRPTDDCAPHAHATCRNPVPSPSGRSQEMENNQSAARQAKRFLDDRLRNDWAYPNLPPAWSASDEEVRDVQDFRERYYGESESSDSNNEEGGAGLYRFDSPDSIGNAVAQTQDARKRRRRERLEQEMRENEGLRIWVERRDMWTGAASVKKYSTNKSARSAPSADRDLSEGHATPSDVETQSVDSITPDTFDIVPVAPRLLAANPIRASITPRAYPDIFQKIVVSSRTPSVPINLCDMTQALVQGWKDTDEWPPRAGAFDPLAGKKRSITGAAVNGHHGGFIGRHPHLGKSVDSVKRILHLNGHYGQEHAQDGKEG